MTRWRYRTDQEDPAWTTTVQELVGDTWQPKDLSGHTLELKLVHVVTRATVFTKSAGVTGTAQGRITAAWAAGELNIALGDYEPHVKGTLGGRDWVMPNPEADVIEIYAAPA